MPPVTKEEWNAKLKAWPRAVTRTPAWAVGMTKLLPGIYIHNEEMHVNMDEVCEALGMEPTPENGTLLEEAVMDAVQTFTRAPVSRERIEV